MIQRRGIVVALALLFSGVVLAQEHPCLEDSTAGECADYKLEDEFIQSDIVKLCEADSISMPWMVGCTLRDACQAEMVESEGLCHPFVLLSTLCVDMPRMEGCGNYNRLCQEGSTVAQCTDFPALAGDLKTVATMRAAFDLCAAGNEANSCEYCTELSGRGCVAPLVTLSEICFNAGDEELEECTGWREMCEDSGAALPLFCSDMAGMMVPAGNMTEGEHDMGGSHDMHGEEDKAESDGMDGGHGMHGGEAMAESEGMEDGEAAAESEGMDDDHGMHGGDKEEEKEGMDGDHGMHGDEAAAESEGMDGMGDGHMHGGDGDKMMPKGPCFEDPSQDNCTDFMYSEEGIAADIKDLCDEMPFMIGCSLRDACESGCVDSNSTACEPMRLLTELCVDMPRMSGCSSYLQLCAENVTVVAQCLDNPPALDGWLGTVDTMRNILAICSSEAAQGLEEQCARCPEPSGRACATPLPLLAEICELNPSLPECEEWSLMCADADLRALVPAFCAPGSVRDLAACELAASSSAEMSG